jgi:hypothetical protein
LKCAAMIMLVCLVGPAAAAGYTMTQNTFLMGENPVKNTMDDSRFEDYADLYWSSYISNPDMTPMTPILAGSMVDIENTMFFWMTNFPFNVSASSFGDGTTGAAEAVSPRYNFGIGTYWRYSSPMPVEGSTFTQGSLTNTSQVQKNRQFLAQEITNKFGL